MSRTPTKSAALAASARVANAPSVVSNVMLGVFLAPILHGWERFDISVGDCVLLGSAGLLLYFAGNLFNDWKDRLWDAKHRPERALPLGLFAPGLYLAIGWAASLCAVWLSATFGIACAGIAGAILVNILIYTWLHKLTPWAVIPMGLCRALLPVLGYAGIARHGETFPLPPAVVLLCATALFLHIAGLSLNARQESMRARDGGGRLLPGLCFSAAVVAAGAATFLKLGLPPVLCLLGWIPYAGWTLSCLVRRGCSIGDRVSGLLAGIPLVDAMVLLPLGLAGSGIPIAGLVGMLALPPSAFLAALWLQKSTPAT